MEKMEKASIESPEYVFNTWLKEKCNESEMIVVNDIPFLVDDCIEILKGNITYAEKNINQLIVKTEDDMRYILEEFL